MLTKFLITAAIGALIGAIFFRARKSSAKPVTRDRPADPAAAETVRCGSCGAWHMASEPCLCGHSRRD